MAREQLNEGIPLIPLSNVKFSNTNPCSVKTSSLSQIVLNNELILKQYVTVYSKLDVKKVNQLFRVDHPNIQRPMMLICDSKNTPCGLVFEFLSRGSVGDYVTGDRKRQFNEVVTPSRILTWFTQLASAISYCKEKEIFHRNIHPSHITPSYLEYLAPEVIEFREQSDAADVYSFGMSLYVCVNKNRRSPFVTDSRDERTVLKSKQKFIRAGNQITTPIDDMFIDMRKREKLQALMEKCWAENPEDRPTMEEVLIEISEI